MTGELLERGAERAALAAAVFGLADPEPPLPTDSDVAGRVLLVAELACERPSDVFRVRRTGDVC